MKRVICVILTLAIIYPCLLVCASAATAYRFELMPEVEYLDATFHPLDGGEVFVYDGVLPPGKYYAYSKFLDGEGYSELISVVFDVQYVDSDDGLGSDVGLVDFEINFFDGSFSSVPLYLSVIVFGDITGVLLVVDDQSMASVLSYLEFISVDDDSPHLSEFVTDDMVDSVFFEILAVLPVVVCGVVLLLSTRKGIAFLRSFLNGA